MVVSPAPVFGHPLIELWIQLKRIRIIEWFKNGPAWVDREAWALDPSAFEALLAMLACFCSVVLLSGDVHYGFAGAVRYWHERDGAQRQARFVQCTSSALKNEERKTRLLGGVPTVRRVPAKLGARVERLLTGLTTPPSGSFLGWSTDDRIPPRRGCHGGGRARCRSYFPSRSPRRRRRTEPDWGHRIDFQPDIGTVAPAGSRSVALHQTAIKLRAESGWSFMRCIVGRNTSAISNSWPAASAAGDDRTSCSSRLR